MKIDTRIIFDLTDGFQSYVEMSQVHSGISVKESRTLIWRPYIKVPAGSWTVIFNGEFEGKEAQSFCDVCAEGGLTVMGICNLRSGKGKIAEISFTNIIANTNVEFRVTPAAGLHIRIDNIILQQHSDNCATIPDVGRNFAIYERSGLNLLLDAESTVDHDIIHNGTWEQEQLDYLKRLAFEYRNDKAKKTFLDIGSYFGLYSLHMSRLNVFDEIIAFEADALNHRQLQANLLLNDPTLFIKTHNFAVSDNNGEAYFFPSWAHPSKNRGGVGLVAEELNLAHRVRVPTRMLDSVLSLSGNIIFIKIDVEGTEFSVLQGMRNILIKNRCVLQIESLIFNDSDIESNKKRNDMLMEMGYRLIHSINPDNYYSNID